MYKDIEKKRLNDRLWCRKYHQSLRLESIRLLGGKCVDCGITDVRVLQLDHKELVRRKPTVERPGGRKILRAIVLGKIGKNELDLRCANCHMIKTYSKDKLKYRSYKSS